MFGRATITLGIGPHSSFFLFLSSSVSKLIIIVVYKEGKLVGMYPASPGSILVTDVSCVV